MRHEQERRHRCAPRPQRRREAGPAVRTPDCGGEEPRQRRGGSGSGSAAADASGRRRRADAGEE